MPQSFLWEHLSTRRFKLFFFRWHFNICVQDDKCLASQKVALARQRCRQGPGARVMWRHGGKVLWEASLRRRIMLTGTHASTRLTEEGWVCVCVCVCVWRCLHCVCVCVKVCREVRQELKHNVRCVCLFWGVSACVCRGICMNTCQHARVCVCVCVCVGHRRVQRVQHVRRSSRLETLWSVVSRTVGTSTLRWNQTCNMLSSVHSERRVSWSLRFPSTSSLCRLFEQHKCHFKLHSTV